MSKETLAEVKELVKRLEKASDDYYNKGDSELTDEQFDSLREELRTIDPNNAFLKRVGAPTTGQLVKHPVPMGSQEKLKTKQEFIDWGKKMLESIGDKARTPFVMEEKLDGITLAVYYEKGKLVQAVTRGDGHQGEDITSNVLMMRNVKRTLPTPFTGVLRAEVMLSIPDFEKHFKPLGHRNPRNTVAGMSRAKKSVEPQLIKMFCPTYFTMVDFENVDNAKGPGQIVEQNQIMKDWKLETVKMLPISRAAEQTNEAYLDQVWQYYQAVAEQRTSLDHEIDGVIIKVNNLSVNNAMGMSSDLRPKAERCVKFEAMGGVTKLLSVELTLGHTGAIIPTAKLAPLGIGGVTVTSALLNNYEEIERLGVAVGDDVRVIRAGDVIPKIIGVAARGNPRTPILIPTECISCGSTLVKDGAHIFCKNEDCEGREMQRLKSWIKKRDIKFIGDTLLEELYTRQGVKEPQDLYALTEEKIAAMPRGAGVVGTAAKTIMAELEKSKTCPLNEFMGSLAIKFLGRRQAEILIQGGMNTLEKFVTGKAEDFAAALGMQTDTGPGDEPVDLGTKANELPAGIRKARKTITALLKAGVVVTEPSEQAQVAPASDGPLSGKSFCFTGAIERVGDDGKRLTRDKMWELVGANGGVVMDEVRSGTTYLVQADPSSQSSKTKKAQKTGTKILSEADFFKMIGM